METLFKQESSDLCWAFITQAEVVEDKMHARGRERTQPPLPACEFPLQILLYPFLRLTLYMLISLTGLN